MRAKITAYNEPTISQNCSDFGINTYWGDGYKNVYYLCGNLGRPTFNDTIETVVDRTGQETRIKNTSVERYTLSTIVGSPFLVVLKQLDKHDIKTLENIDNGDIWTIKNIDIEDDGTLLDVNQRVLISFEIDAITNNNNTDYTIQNEKRAYWDNTDNGIRDIDGLAYYNANSYFSSWQLYYESDDTTPASSGDITMFVYAQKNGVESLLGTFRGEFGDLFTDSTKWQSTQSIWDYFSFSDAVGHTNEIVFAKEEFANDNGYLSDELEDRSIQIRFDLTIDNSPLQATTLDFVYSIFGAFHSAGVQKPSGEYGITTVSKDFEKITISTQNDVRQSLPSGPPGLITAFTQVSSNDWTNKYQIDIAPAGEYGYQNTLVTNGGYLGASYRGANGSDNYTFSVDESFPIVQTSNILAFNTGNNPLQLQIFWKFDKIGTHSNIGDVIDGTAGVFVDGVLDTLFPSIISTSTNESDPVVLMLPDVGKHTIRLQVETTGLDLIFTEFEVQIKPKF